MFTEVFTSLLLSGLIELTDIDPPEHPRGIYVTSHTATSQRFSEILEQVKDHGLNLVVFDIQTSGGKLAYDSKVLKVGEFGVEQVLYKDLRQFIFSLREQGIYTAARFVLFKQYELAHRKPDWALKTKGTGKPFETREGLTWLDPSHPEVQEYLLDVVRELASFGVDEIQFDYVRFPEAGKNLYIGYETYEKEKNREQIITDFIKKASEVVRPYRTKLSIDLFGIVVWNNGFDGRLIGQKVSELAKYVDVIYPMIYPSHFSNGFSGRQNPADDPYYFVNESLKLFQKEMIGKRAELRPWLQAFPLRVSRFSKKYIEEQIRAAKDAGVEEFALWNSGNNYGGILPNF